MAQGPVELWLGVLLLQQQASLHSVIKSSDLEINDEDFDLLSFLDKFQAQVSMASVCQKRKKTKYPNTFVLDFRSTVGLYTVLL